MASDGKTIAAACLDGKLRLWDTATGKELRQFVGGKGELRFLRFSPDGKELIAAWDLSGISFERTYFIWDAATGNESRRFVLPEAYGSNCTELSPDGKLLGEGEYRQKEPCKVRWYDLATGKEAGCSAEAHEDWVQSLAFSADGLLLASAGRDSKVRVWELATGKRRFVFALPPAESSKSGTDFCSVAFTADGKTLLLSQREWYQRDGEKPGYVQTGNRVILWDLTTGKPRCRWDNPVNKGENVNSTSFFAEENVLAFREEGAFGKIYLWDIEAGREVSRLKRQTLYADGMAFGSDGHPLATQDGDGTILIWNLNDPAR